MKKTFLTLAVLILGLPSFAESMKFVTVLSRPLGSFGHVDVTDGNANVYDLRFCNDKLPNTNIPVKIYLNSLIN